MMKQIRVVKPLPITDAILYATDVAEADHAAWSSGTTYALGARVISTTTHKIYESLQAGNLAKDPTNAANAAWWVAVSPTNRWKLFDTSNSTQTAKATSLYYELKPGVACTAAAALNISDATSIRVRVTDPTAGLVYDKTTSLIAPMTTADWYAYFFEGIEYRSNHVALDLPSYPAATIRVDLAGGSGLAVGVLLIGQPKTIGAPRAGLRSGITDYSRKEVNEFGDTVLTQRAFAKRASVNALIERNVRDMTFDLLASLRATPALWVVADDIDPSIVFGWYRDFELLIEYADFAELQIDIEGLT
jgi:hypothetical protein